MKRVARILIAGIAGRLLLATLTTGLALGLAIASLAAIKDWRVGRQVLDATARAGVTPDTFNIYYFGSSTMVGEPYAPEMSIPGIVSATLDGAVAGRAIRSVNLGESGSDLASGMTRLRHVLRHTEVTRPSLVVIYAGHNEFLKYHGPVARRLRDLPRAVVDSAQRIDALNAEFEADDRRPLDEAILPESERAGVVAEYGRGLDEALRLLAAERVPVVISTIASNDAEWEPNRSVFCEGRPVPPDFSALVARGVARQANGDFAGAITAYRSALAACDTIAELHFRIGTCERRLGRADRARREFALAVDQDGMPIRQLSAMNAAIRRTADRPGVTVVDAEELLRPLTADGLLGFDVMVDGHHPNVRGYVAIGTAIAGAIRSGQGAGKTAWQPLTDAAAEARFGLNTRKQFEVAISRGRWFSRLSTWRFDPSERLALAAGQFERARQLDGNRFEVSLGLGLVALLRGRPAEGERYLARAQAQAPDAAAEYLEEPWVRAARTRAPRLEEEGILDGGQN